MKSNLEPIASKILLYLSFPSLLLAWHMIHTLTTSCSVFAPADIVQKQHASKLTIEDFGNTSCWEHLAAATTTTTRHPPVSPIHTTHSTTIVFHHNSKPCWPSLEAEGWKSVTLDSREFYLTLLWNPVGHPKLFARRALFVSSHWLNCVLTVLFTLYKQKSHCRSAFFIRQGVGQTSSRISWKAGQRNRCDFILNHVFATGFFVWR